MSIFTRTGTHALKALAILASVTKGAFADAREIAKRIGAPPNYLAKLLGQLAKAGIVEARKGSGGGFRLARPASAMSLYEVLEPIEQLVKDGDCILGREGCDGSEPCQLHERWAAIRAETLDFLNNTSLASLAEGRGGQADQNSMSRRFP